MGYDMHIIEPDPAALAESERVRELLYGHDAPKGAVIRRNEWPKSGWPKEIRGTDVTDLHAHYEPGTGDPGFWSVLDEIVALQAEHAPLEAQHYFRLNVWGMSLARDVMGPLGMVYEPTEHPEYPEWPEGVERDWDALYETWSDDYELPTDACPPEMREYVEERHRWLAYAEERPGINVRKFGSNDGWIVTPIECAGALHQWKVNADDPTAVPRHKDRLVEWWPDWLAFLLHASAHGGFSVD